MVRRLGCWASGTSNSGFEPAGEHFITLIQPLSAVRAPHVGYHFDPCTIPNNFTLYCLAQLHLYKKLNNSQHCRRGGCAKTNGIDVLEDLWDGLYCYLLHACSKCLKQLSDTTVLQICYTRVVNLPNFTTCMECISEECLLTVLHLQ